MIMPRMGGAELLQRLKAMDGGLKVLLCSGYNYSADAVEGLDQVRRDFIQKPFTLQLLSTKIRQLLDA